MLIPLREKKPFREQSTESQRSTNSDIDMTFKYGEGNGIPHHSDFFFDILFMTILNYILVAKNIVHF